MCSFVGRLFNWSVLLHAWNDYYSTVNRRWQHRVVRVRTPEIKGSSETSLGVNGIAVLAKIRPIEPMKILHKSPILHFAGQHSTL